MRLPALRERIALTFKSSNTCACAQDIMAARLQGQGTRYDMCGKVVRKEGTGRDASTLVSLISLTQPLYLVG